MQPNHILPKCGQCGRDFATEAALSQHLTDKHKSGERPSHNGDAGQRPKSKSLRRRNRHPVAIGIGGVGVVLLIGFYLLAAPSLAAPPVPCGTGETWIHVHPYLSISVEGVNVVVPEGIGMLQNGACLEVMHTHDASGIIHIELAQTDANTNYTLSDFFRVWNATYRTVTFNGSSHPVTFSANGIFGYQVDATHRLTVLVDGKPVADGTKVPLEQLDYCSSANANVPPCQATAGGNPLWDGSLPYPYGTGHTISIEYTSG